MTLDELTADYIGLGVAVYLKDTAGKTEVIAGTLTSYQRSKGIKPNEDEDYNYGWVVVYVGKGIGDHKDEEHRVFMSNQFDRLEFE